ncbi:vicilin-like seed storage protein At2g18540 [Cynara cardunculus var. scolymus]|uniref:vicilin-like seed storage protein At2g18540 n=1 Tax=Cynara cardunculus var. scolymus TaxID=59895 RepID=UPI000D62437F|nr:vicilin-like seed storage protein At2g18540 [Cynara cardunculus var. scolymus]
MLTQYRPTVNKEGYATERPIAKRLMRYMKSKEIKRAHKRTHTTLEPVSRTPLRIGIAEEDERPKDTLRPQVEGEMVRVSAERAREKERKREEARKKKVERERKKKEEADRAKQEKLTELAHVRAEEERAEKARQTEIARLREEARLRVEEETRQHLAQSSS